MSDKILTANNTLFIGMDIDTENGESQHVEISPHDVVECVDGIQSGYGLLANQCRAIWHMAKSQPTVAASFVRQVVAEFGPGDGKSEAYKRFNCFKTQMRKDGIRPDDMQCEIDRKHVKNGKETDYTQLQPIGVEFVPIVQVIAPSAADTGDGDGDTESGESQHVENTANRDADPFQLATETILASGRSIVDYFDWAYMQGLIGLADTADFVERIRATADMIDAARDDISDAA